MSALNAGRLTAWCHWTSSNWGPVVAMGGFHFKDSPFRLSNKTGWSLGHYSRKLRTSTSTRKQWIWTKNNKQETSIYLSINGTDCCDGGFQVLGKTSVKSVRNSTLTRIRSECTLSILTTTLTSCWPCCQVFASFFLVFARFWSVWSGLIWINHGSSSSQRPTSWVRPVPAFLSPNGENQMLRDLGMGWGQISSVVIWCSECRIFQKTY